METVRSIKYVLSCLTGSTTYVTDLSGYLRYSRSAQFTMLYAARVTVHEFLCCFRPSVDLYSGSEGPERGADLRFCARGLEENMVRDGG